MMRAGEGVLTNGANSGAHEIWTRRREMLMTMFKCNVTVVLRHPVRGADGGTEYEETPSPALWIESSSREARATDAPALRAESEFLFPPPAEPLPGDLVRCGGVDYELATVRVCRDLDGGIVCRRCLAAR